MRNHASKLTVNMWIKLLSSGAAEITSVVNHATACWVRGSTIYVAFFFIVRCSQRNGHRQRRCLAFAALQKCFSALLPLHATACPLRMMTRKHFYTSSWWLPPAEAMSNPSLDHKPGQYFHTTSLFDQFDSNLETLRIIFHRSELHFVERLNALQCLIASAG